MREGREELPGSEGTYTESRFQEQRAKSKSLDNSFRGSPPSASTLAMLGQEAERNKNRVRTEQETGGFLSRLFGSKRSKMRSSASKKELEEPREITKCKPGCSLIGSVAEPRLSHYQAPSPGSPPSPCNTSHTSPCSVSPHRSKTKPPAPPPPMSSPPMGQPMPPMPPAPSPAVYRLFQFVVRPSTRASLFRC